MLFPPFWLDPVTQELWHETERVALRPKPFAVLHYLVTHAGQVVTRAALVQAVWPETSVSEEVLRGYIRDLRAVLGDDAQAPRFIETLPRRGYRFIGHVRRPEATANSPQDEGGDPAPGALLEPSPRLVGREAEHHHLHGWLAKARRGARQFVFVTGEPGIGKTTLVDAFLAQAVASGDVWVGRGQCVEHYGVGEAYMPLLDALARLCRQPGGARLLEILGQYAPAWLVQLPALCSAAALDALQRRVHGTARERMLRELAEALEALTTEMPLVLVLEDLHWSDYATLDCLAVLARRRERARLLVLGTYRPADVLVRGHPLRALTQELHGHGQCVELPLGGLPAPAVCAYLAERFQPSVLPPALGGVLHQRTDGHPLFMVQVVDDWVRQGVLVAPAGRPWQLGVPVEDVTARLPASARQLIEGQLSQLPLPEQRVLEVASVAGAEFFSAAVAAGAAEPCEHVEAQCDALAQRGHFLRARGTEVLPDGTVTGRYGFVHALEQQVVYERLAAARRLRLHRRLGAWEEAAYGPRVHARAAALAMHFERGQDYPRAVQYLWHAAENASRRHAPQEAIALLTKGLALLQAVPDTPARAQQELALSLSLGPALVMTQGYAAPAVAHAYYRAQALCQQLGESPQLGLALAGLFRFYYMRAEFPAARDLGAQMLRLAQRTSDPEGLLIAHSMLGPPCLSLGELGAAHEHLAQGIALYDMQQHRGLALRYGDDPGVTCRSLAALVLWCRGYPDQALQSNHAALALAQALATPYTLAFALSFTAWIHTRRREGRAAQTYSEALTTLATAHGFQFWTAEGTILRGWALTAQGQHAEGLAQMHQGLAAYQATGAEMGRPSHLALLAEAYGNGGQPAEGLTVLAQAFTAVDTTRERLYEAELHRLRGELWRHHGLAESAVEACFRQALALARRQGAKALELRAAVSLSRLWQSQGQRAEARQLLAEVYGWFTEGFDTADLQEAKALLEGER
jgi:DNA-binding winged helix-turn-helix (wHTH) protein/predicted ATPase